MAQRGQGRPDGLSIHAAAHRAGVCYETVARWIRAGGLRARKIRVRGRSSQWRIRESDLRQFLRG